jgi:hypothetical protein
VPDDAAPCLSMRCPHCNKDTVPFWKVWFGGAFVRYKCSECGGLSRIRQSTQLVLVTGCLWALAALVWTMYWSWPGLVLAMALAFAFDSYLEYRYRSLQPDAGGSVGVLRSIGQNTGLWIAIALVLVGIGGFYVGWHSARQYIPVTDLFTAAQHEVFLSAVRTSGDDAAYENALRSNLSFLDTLNARSSHERWDQWSYAFDRALTLARLSRLAQKRGANDEAERLAQDAEALCPAAGLRGCSVSTLLEVADKMDNGTLFDSPETPK